MTPTQIEEAARRRYNAVGDTFWSQDEIFQYIYDACLELARETLCIERVYTTTTVAGTQEYAFPTNAMAIKRVTYNGMKLKPISMREDDSITGLDQSSSSQGTPVFYWMWDKTISLRPIPAEALTLKIYAYNFPSTLTATAALEVPDEFQMKLIHFVLQQMAAKDSNYEAAQYYQTLWEQAKTDAKRWMKKMKRGDAMSYVQDDELLPDSYLGTV